MKTLNADRVLEAFVASQTGATRQLTQFVEHWCRQADMIDPREPYIGPDGEMWLPIGSSQRDQMQCAYRSEAELSNVRSIARCFADENEFAINSHENRISYLVGWGHGYQVMPKQGEDISDDELKAVKEIVDEFLRVNRWSPSYVIGSRGAAGRQSWGYRQQQNVYRRDRDGEVFLRKFRSDDGILQLRYIEPEAVRTPESMGSRKNIRFGIETDPEDEETVLSYYVDDQRIDASEVQHRTRGGSPRHPRGLPIHWPVRKNLVRAQKILRNGSTVTEFQVAIAMIRKHIQGTAQTVQAFQQSLTQIGKGGGGSTGVPQKNEQLQQRFAPGTILDASANVEYEFPGASIDPSKYVVALQAELRAIASRLVMPEFMLSSDASNANFASTMVAEGPAVKNFERLQWDEIAADLELIWDALNYAAESGRISPDLLDRIDVLAEPPSVKSRDQVQDAQVAQILDGLGWLSPQTGAAMFGLDYEQEQANKEQHNEQFGLPLSFDRPALPPTPGEEDELDHSNEEPPEDAQEAMNQPRVPAGSSQGGQFASKGATGKGKRGSRSSAPGKETEKTRKKAKLNKRTIPQMAELMQSKGYSFSGVGAYDLKSKKASYRFTKDGKEYTFNTDQISKLID